jgi:hypothetical protein
LAFEPGGSAETVFSTLCAWWTGLALDRQQHVAGLTPALSAGPLRSTPLINAPVCPLSLNDAAVAAVTSCISDADPAARRRCRCARSARAPSLRGGRNREADADRAARLRHDRGVDADEVAAHVDQRTAGIALVDRRVGLDEILEHVDAEAGTVDGGDDSARSPFARRRDGLPIASAMSPTRSVSEVPNEIAGSLSAFTRSTARSVSGSSPTTWASSGCRR